MHGRSSSGGAGRSSIYVANLLVSFHYFLIIYVNSTYLSLYAGTQELSFLYLGGSLVSMLVFASFASVVKRVGNWRLALVFIALEAAALGAVGFSHDARIVIGAFVLFVIVSPVIYLNLDIFLEKTVADEKTTGGVRGMFLTMQNITQVVSPFLAGLLLAAGIYSRAYAASLVFLSAAFVVTAFFLRRFDDGRYHARSLWRSAAYVLKHPILYDVVVSQFLLRFFYAWMVIYTPLYLVRTIGFSWSQVGTMFAIMLVPFLLLELPLGRMVDGNLLKEKNVLVFGFVLMAGAVAVFPFLATPAFAAWASVLFISRIGASCTEIATESYFFRHVDGSLADTISFFRFLRPASYVAAAAFAALILQVVSLRFSFFALAALMAFGLRYAVRLRGK